MNGKINKKRVLIDTNIFLALAFPRDVHHREARDAMSKVTGERIVAAPVLPELFYLVTERVGYLRAIEYFNYIRTGAFYVEALTDVDMARMDEIMMQYADNQFDFVDVSIMALAERLNVNEIYTFDQRDFMTFRPAHRPYLRLLP